MKKLLPFLFCCCFLGWGSVAEGKCSGGIGGHCLTQYGNGIVINASNWDDVYPYYGPWPIYWDFGDGYETYTIPNEEYIFHQYEEPGIYTITVVACGEHYLTVEIPEGEPNEPVISGQSINYQDFECGFDTTYEVWQSTRGYAIEFGSSTDFLQFDYSDAYPYDIRIEDFFTFERLYTDYPVNFNLCVTAGDLSADGCCVSTFCEDIVLDTIPFNMYAYFDSHSNWDGTWFHNESYGENYTSYWDFGDGQVSYENSPHHIYAENGTYVVCLVATDTIMNVSDTICKSVYINYPENCIVSFDAEQEAAEDKTVHFTDGSVAFVAPIVAWLWDFGDGGQSAVQNPVHQYLSMGGQEVTLTVTTSSGATYSKDRDIYVHPQLPDFGVSTNIQADGSVITCFDNVLLSDDYIAYTWQFGDGAVALDTEVCHTYTAPGIYEACLSASTANGDVYSGCQEVDVEQLQYCDTRFNTIFNEAAQSFSFVPVKTYDTYINAYSWSFGDGGTSQAANPSHTYAEPGYYGVCLATQHAEGCTYEHCEEVFFDGCSADFGSEAVGDGLTLRFTNLSESFAGIETLGWSFGDGGTSASDTVVHQFPDYGYYNVCLDVLSETGCESTLCHEILLDNCEPDFTYSPLPGDGLSLSFLGFVESVGEPETWQWSFGDGGTSASSTVVHQFPDYGYYNVCLDVLTETGCESTVCRELLLDNCEPGFTYSPLSGDGLSLSFSGFVESVGEPETWQWNFGDSGTSTSDTVVHQFPDYGYYNVCLDVLTETGCESTVCHEILLDNCEPGFTYSQQSGDGLSLSFSGFVYDANILEWYWVFGDEVIFSPYTIVHQFPDYGYYDVCLDVESETGCQSSVCHEVLVDVCDLGIEVVFDGDEPWKCSFAAQGNSFSPIESFEWTVDGAFLSDQSNPQFEFGVEGLHLVCLAAETQTGCFVYHCEEMEVSTCQGGFQIDMLSDTSFLFVPEVASVAPVSQWVWTVGEMEVGEMETPPSVVITQNGVYDACMSYQTENGCGGTHCQTFVVDECDASFAADVSVPLVGSFSPATPHPGNIAGVQWSFGDGEVSEGFEVAHTYGAAGEYEVCLTVASGMGCVEQSCQTVVVEDDGTGLGGLVADGVRLDLQPALATDMIMVETGGFDPANATISLYDAAGGFCRRIRPESGSFELPLEGLPPGIYLLHLQIGERRMVRKFAKLR